MRTYICDICNTPIANPFKLKMKEFYIGYTYERVIGAVAVDSKVEKKIHMCSSCFDEFVYTCQKKKAYNESQ